MTHPRHLPSIPRPRSGRTGTGAADRPAPITGRAAPIDVEALRTGLAALHSPHRAERDATVDAIRASPERYPPPVLYALAHTLFQRGERDAAIFWYHAGQLRARFDVERCADPTVADVIMLLRGQYGDTINRYAFVEADLAVLRSAVQRAVRWDRRTPHAYDHRWVNLHGVRAFAEPGQHVALSRPPQEWDRIASRVREDYLDGMRAVLDDLERWAPLTASA
jgi:hypothetical protein